MNSATTNPSHHVRCWVLTLLSLLPGMLSLCAQTITGEMKVWYPVTITFDGPTVSEVAATFRNNRMNITFTKGAKSLTVPGYFAADGNAAETSATSGNQWRVKFTPDEAGTWSYSVSFRTGTDIAVSTAAGTPGSLDGISGNVTIAAADPAAPGFYAKGMLKYVGEHYLQFAGTGEWFVKAGPGSPEDVFGYEDFDGTVDEGGSKDDSSLGADGLHAYAAYQSYTPHTSDWQPGDPVWQGTKGKGIIGAINYLASVGVNTLYNVLLTANGDSDTVWPWTTSTGFDIYDVSKLDQWDIVFAHMDARGVNTDVYLSESENTKLLDNGTLGTLRKIYYRELMARFGYHLGWRWCVGEEPQFNSAQVAAFAAYMQTIDPYSRGIGSHCNYQKVNRDPFYNALIGNTDFNGAYMQIVSMGEIHPDVRLWVSNSAAAGHKWVVNVDEPPKILPGDATRARELFWSILTAGGEGLDVYVAYDDAAFSDITVESFRPLASVWQPLAHGLQFFRRPEVNPRLPHMVNRDDLVASGNFCFAKVNDAYIVYSKSPAGMTLNLNGASGGFDVRWFDPRNGGGLQSGSVTSVTGGGSRSLGNPPSATTSDWVALVFKPGQLSANAGSDQTVVIAPGATEATVSLTGSVSAGGEPYVAAWSQLSGPGTTGFANSNAPVTTATLTGDPGAYVLQLAATSGTNTAADTVVVTVSTNMPPAVSNLLVNPGIEGTLSPWTAYNDGSCDVQWTTSTSHSGSGAARVYNRVNRWNGVQQDIKSILLANGPGHYAYSAWARTETGVLNAYVTLRMKESGGNNRYFAAPALSIHSTAWQQSAITNFLAWTNLAEAFLYFETSSVETDSFLVDDFVLLPVPPPDTVAPVVGITAPANGSSFIEGAAVTVEAVVSDDGGMAEARLLVNGLWTQTDGAAPYAFEVNGLAAGAHLITVVGVDLAGNQGSNSVTVNIIPPDITPPAVSFLSPTNGQSYYEGQSVPVVIQATDNVVVQEVYLSVDTPVNEVATLPAPPFEHTLTGLPAGPRVLIARAIDTSYNTAFATNSVIVLPRPVLNLDRTQDGLELNWAPTNWLLERSLHLNPSTWDVVVDASSPHWVTTTSSSSFYRLRLP